ncbi:hypothetical protein GCM10023169_16940 [Georgenia halophila]|uniref:HTH tetR-type domain-containing protein n=1 Tax=Georgenia halophila TaxID=620889 RepID=A0ABP8L5C5_9MICO
MPRRPDPAQQERRRDAIVEAAATLFAEKGYEATTAADIGRAAGLSGPSVFYYFEDKATVFRALFERDVPRLRAVLERESAGDDPVDALLTIVRDLAADVNDPIAPGLVAELVRRAPHDPALAQVVMDADARTQRVLTALVERAVDVGRARPGLPAAVVARWIQIVVDGVALHGGESSDDPWPALRTLVLRFLRAEEKP